MLRLQLIVNQLRVIKIFKICTFSGQDIDLKTWIIYVQYKYSMMWMHTFNLKIPAFDFPTSEELTRLVLQICCFFFFRLAK